MFISLLAHNKNVNCVLRLLRGRRPRNPCKPLKRLDLNFKNLFIKLLSIKNITEDLLYMNKGGIAKDTLILTVIQLFVQVLSLLLNVFITRKLGSAAMGITALIYSFFGFVTVISNGNIFVSTSRLVSEEIGKKKGNPGKIFSYSLLFSVMLSLSSALIVFFAAESFAVRFLKDSGSVVPIRLLSLSLPLASLGTCMKAYFHAHRKIAVPAIADTAEFLIKSALIAFLTEFFIISNRMSIMTGISVSICVSEIVSCLFMAICFVRFKSNSKNKCSISFKKYLFLVLPIMLNSYITVILSSTNEALVPLTLKQFGNSTAEALGQYGTFEAIILPVLFFPSVLLSCLSCILVPEISRERSAGNEKRVSALIDKVLGQTFSYSIYIASIILLFGNQIGELISGESFAGKFISLLAPVIPFIYLEIILEGILRGLGKHSFSSLNYIAEYIIRISVLLISVPVLGFYGLVLSYYSSNIICNAARIVIAVKTTGFRFKPFSLIVKPVFSIVFATQAARLIMLLFNGKNLDFIPHAVIFSVICGIIYRMVEKILPDKLPEAIFSKKALANHSKTL